MPKNKFRVFFVFFGGGGGGLVQIKLVDPKVINTLISNDPEEAYTAFKSVRYNETHGDFAPVIWTSYLSQRSELR